MMNCDGFLLLIDDYVDGTLNTDQHTACETHTTTCAECRKEAEAMRVLLTRAKALPESIQPQRDLWPEIQDRIERRVLAFPKTHSRRPAAVGFIQAAALVAAIVGGILLIDTQRKTVVPDTPVSASSVEREYLDAKERLLAELYTAEAQLPEAVVTTVEENLRVIENAVLDIRTALADDPDNPHLERILIATYKNQIDLLQHAVLLAHES